MSKLSEKLKAMHIHNTHELLKKFGGKNDVAIFYYPGESRGIACGRAGVYSVHFNTDPKSAFYNYGRKTFVGDKKVSVPKAKDWVAKEYRITEWATCPMDRSALIPAKLRRAVEEYVRSKEKK